MKKVLLTTLLLGFYTLLMGQVSYQKAKAKKDFDDLNYASAIVLYEELLAANATDVSDLKNLAEAYLKVNDSKDAERILKMVVALDKNDYNYLKKLALVLSSNAKYDESLITWRKYHEEIPHDVTAINSLTFLEQLSKIEHDSLFIDLFDLNINTHWTEFSPFVVGQNMVFVSNRAIGPVHLVSEWNHTPFLDLYYADTTNIIKTPYKRPLGSLENEVLHVAYSDKIEKLHTDHTPETANESTSMGYYGHHPSTDSMWDKDKSYGQISLKFNKHLHSKYHEGSIAFSADQKKMFYTTNDAKSQKNDGFIKLMIMEADLNDKGKYKDVKKLPFNNINYSVCHPAILKDGNTLIFASNMPGGYGGMDLYKVVLNGETWGTSVNLGPTVNTNGSEVFPFVDADNVLYFSSDGWGSFGGLDIVKKDLNSEEKPKNLAYPINSNKDDFGYMVVNKQHAYLSSNRRNGGSDDDIYYVFDKRREKKRLVVITQLKKLDGTIIPLDSIKLTVTNIETNKDIRTLNSARGIPTSFELPTRQKYKVTGVHPDVETLTALVDFNEDLVNDDTIRLVFVQKDDNVLLKSKVVDATTKMGLANVKVHVYDKKSKSHQIFTTDKDGNYEFKGKQKRSYLVKAMRDGYFADCEQLVVKKTNTTAFVDALKLSKVQKNVTFEIKDLYYDYNKWAIRPDAELVLVRLVHFLNDYPEIGIELGSHTDARGGDKFNQELSLKRATSAVDYVVSMGIDHARITARGYGESKLLNKCKNDVKCTDEQHQINRRTEVKVTTVKKELEVKTEPDSNINPFENLGDFDPCKKVVLGK